MNIYFSGIGGVGIGPLAEIARDAGYGIQGSDAMENLVTEELKNSGVRVSTDQSGDFLESCHRDQPIDWFVHTAALPNDHAELVKARALGIRTAKRDELLNEIIRDKGLKLIAVAGTHGKTTTTGMMVWTMQQLGIPVSYSVGTTLSFGPSGMFDPKSKYFVYECDEFDRNFLHFKPYLSLITSIDYDHPDTYPTISQYSQAFNDFLSLSDHVIMWQHDTAIGINPPARAWVLQDQESMSFQLAGAHNRANATLVAKAIEYMSATAAIRPTSPEEINQAVNIFPGTDRRFERLSENLYSDYGHHPAEIAATLQMARELSDTVVLVYQPHQNTRQHEIRDQYSDCFEQASTVYWLPTYLSRENTELEILSPQQLAENLHNKDDVRFAEMNDQLWQTIETHLAEGHLVLCMGAGSIDAWIRKHLAS